MVKYINYESLIDAIDWDNDIEKWTLSNSQIDNFPAADVAPVRHGRWIDNGVPGSILSGCSVCGFSCGAYTFNYCPNCGALMDGGKDDG